MCPDGVTVARTTQWFINGGWITVPVCGLSDDVLPLGADPIDYNRVAENLGMTHLDLQVVYEDWDV